MKKRYDWKATLNFEVSFVGGTKRQTDQEIKEDIISLLKKRLEETKKPKFLKIDRTWRYGKEKRI